jgi:outer membrane receptor protein involved in Fe transport
MQGRVRPSRKPKPHMLAGPLAASRKKMKKITTILILLIQTNLFAQNFDLQGIVLEETSREPLYGATVYLTSTNDSTIISGGISDSIGRFVLRDLGAYDYMLTIEYIGFETLQKPVHINRDSDLGYLLLNPSALLMDEVTVSAEKTRMIHNLDKKVYNVTSDMFSESGSATEILQNIPSLNVDINGGITLRNTSNITFFINGRPSAMLRRNAFGYLEQIPASSIERIEIITNPSAKYRPDGAGGIVNIVLKEEVNKGWNGLIGANLGTEQRVNGNINLNFGKENYSLFASYSIRHSNPTYLFNESRSYLDGGEVAGIYSDNGQSRTKALSHTLLLGASYEMNDYNTFELSGTYFLQSSLHNTISAVNADYLNDSLDFAFDNYQTNDEVEEEGEASFTLEHVFKNNEDHTLAFEFAWSGFNEREDLNFDQKYFLPMNENIHNDILIEKNGNQKEVLLDYTLPVGEDMEIEAGYAGEHIFENIQYSNITKSQFQFNQNVHALYGLWTQGFDGFGYKIGIRAEQTNINSHLLIPDDKLIPNNYFKLFPTLHIQYELNDVNQFSLSYSKRINRPDADELNPNPEFTDPRNAESGNPDILPEQVHSFEFGYRYSNEKFSITPTLYYRYKYDAFTSIQQNLNDSIVLSTILNLDSRQSTGLETVLNGRLTTKWDFDLTGNVFHTTIDATSLGYTSNKSAISGNLKLNSKIQLEKGTKLQLGAFYYFPSITPQGRTKSIFYMNCGLRQSLFKNRAALIVTTTDMLHSYNVEREIESNDLNQVFSIQRIQPIVYVGFSLKLNNYKSKDELFYEGEGLRK